MSTTKSKSTIKRAFESRPAKPLNGYFQYRNDKMIEYRKDGIQRPGAKFNDHWINLSDKEKDRLNQEAAIELDKWKVSYDKWLTKHGLDEDDVKEYIRETKEVDQKVRERSKSSKSSRSKSAKKGRKSTERSKSSSKKVAKKSNSKSKSKSKSNSKSRSKDRKAQNKKK